MSTSLSILIAGGGIGGLCTAGLLAAKGFHVELFEKADEFREIGAGLQLSPNAMAVLDHMGLGQAIAVKSVAPDYAALKDYKTGKKLLETPLGDRIKSQYGQPYFHIHRADLVEILLSFAKDHGVTLHLSEQVTTYKGDADHIQLTTNKGTYEGDVLIGADGINSAIRAQMHGHDPARFTGQIAWRGIVETSSLPANLLPKAAHVWMGPGAHFVAYYIRGGALVNFIAVKEQQGWAKESWSEAANMAELRAHFSGWDKPVYEILHACEEAYLWGLFDRPPLPFWSKERATLLGDAAHPMLPFMAQGAAQAIEDAYVLTDSLSQYDVSHALKNYEKIRRPRTAKIQKISRDNAALYHANSHQETIFRQIKLGLAQHIPALQRVKLAPIYGYDVTKNRA